VLRTPEELEARRRQAGYDLNISAWTHPWGARSAGPRGMGDSMRVVADRWRDPPATTRPDGVGAQGSTGPQDNDMAAVAARWADSAPLPPRGPAASATAASATTVPLMSTWDMMEHVWDRHKRPDHLLIPDVVNSYTIDQMLVYKQHYQQQEKQEGKGDSVFTRDAKLQTKSYPAGDDNCAELLHPARFERLPVVPLKLLGLGPDKEAGFPTSPASAHWMQRDGERGDHRQDARPQHPPQAGNVLEEALRKEIREH